jgi:hypothetical protein
VEQQPGRFQLARHVREAELQGLKLLQLLAELPAGQQVVPRHRHGSPGRAQGTGADVHPAAVEAHHGDLEALALFAQAVGDRHGCVLQATGTVASSRITMAVGWLCQPSFFSGLPKLSPGVSLGTTRAEMPSGPSPPVRHRTR